MSNYTISVDWDGKDNLADSNAAKVISGDDFQTEFETVQTAINSKANLNGASGEDFAMNNGTIAGNVTAPTQSAGNNTTRLATTAFVTTAVAALDAAAINAIVYPIGSIFTTVSSTAPATLLGMGTWVAFGAGKVMVGIDASDTAFDTAEETGGSKTDSHTLTTAELPSHTHTVNIVSGESGSHTGLSGGGSRNLTGSQTIPASGSGGAHSHDIVQPYIVVYMYKRTA